MSGLVTLRGLRTAPDLDEVQRQALTVELGQRLEACEWFTIGVMAPSAEAAVESLRQAEGRLGWPPLAPMAAPDGTQSNAAGPVFLKGNQSTGRFSLRQEEGLGAGILITGHAPTNPDAEDTWGPLPLDFFS